MVVMIARLVRTRMAQSPLRMASHVPLTRSYADLNRPGPIPLPRKDQEEFERLQREAQKDTENPLHAAYQRYEEFEGPKNPVTGEIGGPKQDPLRHGDYSFDGRVTDF